MTRANGKRFLAVLLAAVMLCGGGAGAFSASAEGTDIGTLFTEANFLTASEQFKALQDKLIGEQKAQGATLQEQALAPQSVDYPAYSYIYSAASSLRAWYSVAWRLTAYGYTTYYAPTGDLAAFQEGCEAINDLLAWNYDASGEIFYADETEDAYRADTFDAWVAAKEAEYHALFEAYAGTQCADDAQDSIAAKVLYDNQESAAYNAFWREGLAEDAYRYYQKDVENEYAARRSAISYVANFPANNFATEAANYTEAAAAYDELIVWAREQTAFIDLTRDENNALNAKLNTIVLTVSYFRPTEFKAGKDLAALEQAVQEQLLPIFPYGSIYYADMYLLATMTEAQQNVWIAQQQQGIFDVVALYVTPQALLDFKAYAAAYARVAKYNNSSLENLLLVAEALALNDYSGISGGGMTEAQLKQFQSFFNEYAAQLGFVFSGESANYAQRAANYNILMDNLGGILMEFHMLQIVILMAEERFPVEELNMAIPYNEDGYVFPMNLVEAMENYPTLIRDNLSLFVYEDIPEIQNGINIRWETDNSLFTLNMTTGEVKFKDAAKAPGAKPQALTLYVNNMPLLRLLISVDVFTLSESSLTLDYKGEATLTTSAKADKWESDNESLVTVDQNGKVQSVHSFTKTGSATITATAADGRTATCKVEVKPNWWQWILIIVLFGWIWY
ncbi:MAG: Ig-like domain-containing protein [Oscillospiraceae bacterium]|jgi:hypothetical protein|nr:Ig-like domain-containing protein [Oscillospiraceae bacterium]